MSQTPPAVPPSEMAMAPPPTPPPPTYIPGGQKKAVGLAVAALVLGICGFIPWLGLLCGLIGIIFGIVALAQQTSRKGLAIAGIITGVTGPVLMIALMVSILAPTLNRSKGNHWRVRCMSNLKSIGLAISFYTSENEDVYPTDLESILDYIGDEELLKCPSARSSRACDYFYCQPTQKTTEVVTPLNTILACDFRDNHGGKGRNVLYADMRVQWLSEEEFQAKLQQSYNADFAKALREAERF